MKQWTFLSVWNQYNQIKEGQIFVSCCKTKQIVKVFEFIPVTQKNEDVFHECFANPKHPSLAW